MPRNPKPAPTNLLATLRAQREELKNRHAQMQAQYNQTCAQVRAMELEMSGVVATHNALEKIIVDEEAKAAPPSALPAACEETKP